MRRFLVSALFCLLAGPAFAGWALDDISTEEGLAYRGWVPDSTGGAQLEIYCDDWWPGLIELTVYTGEMYEATTSYAEEGVMTVVVDGDEIIETTAYFDEMDEELVFFSSNFDVENMVEVVLLMAGAASTIDISYFDKTYRFSSENAHAVIEQLATDCSSE